MSKIDLLVATLKAQIKSCDATLVRFTEKLAKDPAYAFSWGSDAIAAAARRKLAQQVLAWLQQLDERMLADEDKIEMIRAELTKGALRAARYPARSTSGISNLVEQEEGAAHAELLEDIQHL